MTKGMRLSMKNKIIVGLWILVIIVGIVMVFTFKFNLDENYGSSVKVSIDFNEAFKLDDVKLIAAEVFGNEKYKVEYSNEFKNGVFITTKEVSDEQLKSLEDKLINKYEKFDDDTDVVVKLTIPSIRIMDLVKEYIKPIVITTVLVLIALMIMFRKAGFVKALFIPAAQIIGIGALYISLVAIARIPISEYVIAIGVLVYASSLIGVTLYTKNKLDRT